MHDGMPYGRNQYQRQGHSREVDRQSPTGLIFIILLNLFSALTLLVACQEGHPACTNILNVYT